MNRREWIKSAAAVSAAMAAASNNVAALAPRNGNGTWETSILRLKLRHTWATTMSSSDYRDTLHVRFTRDGITGHGEGAPIVRYHEDAVGCRDALEPQLPFLSIADPFYFEKVWTELSHRIDEHFAAKAAADVALLDWVAQKMNVPLYALFGLDPQDAPVTTFSIGIDDPAKTRDKVLEADAYPVLKIKVGLKSDEASIAAVRSVTSKPLRVDANEGWTDKEEAVRKINWLATQGVEFVEQPMPAQMLEEMHWVHSRVKLPIIADEAAVSPDAIPHLVGAYDGVNVKLDKCGGIQPALRMIQIAKALGMKTMLGCMISSSVSVTAAAHLSPLVDYADLDGNLLIANDPFKGVLVEKGKLILPSSSGLGLTPIT